MHLGTTIEWINAFSVPFLVKNALKFDINMCISSIFGGHQQAIFLL